MLLDVLDHLDLEAAVALRTVDHHGADAGLRQGIQTFAVFGLGADGGTDHKVLRIVFGGIWEVAVLAQVAAAGQCHQAAVLVYNGQLALLAGAQDLVGFQQADALLRRDKVGGHDVAQLQCVVELEVDVAVRDHADELAFDRTVFGDGDATEAVLVFDAVHVFYGVIGAQHQRVKDEAVFEAPHFAHLGDLLFDAAVVVDDSDAAAQGQCYGHAVLGHGVHGRADQRPPQRDVACQPGCQVNIGGAEIDVAGHQDDVVVGQRVRRALKELGCCVAVGIGHVDTSSWRLNERSPTSVSAGLRKLFLITSMGQI